MSRAVAPVLHELRARLKERYLRFFREIGVDHEIGVCHAWHPARRKFATYPYVGSEYGNGDAALLVVGWDIGSDETPGRIQDFESRRRAIECKPVDQHNPHIAGTYFTALKYTGPASDWETFEDDHRTCQRILKDEVSSVVPGLPPMNPLSRIALTNFYKWVTVGRTKKGGGTDRIHFNRDLEIELFRDEVRILEPDVVVFQSATFRFLFEELLGPSAAPKSHVLKHPSVRGYKQPKEIVRPVDEHPPI